MEKENNKKIFSGLIWKFSERFCAQFVSFAISILLARLLLPEDYGVIALVLVFIDIANVLVTNGFSTALIQKKDANDLDFSTMFWSSCAISIFIYCIIFALSGYIAMFYNNSLLTPVLRVLALKIPLSSINSIQHAYVSKKMLFKKFFLSTLIGTIISGVVGIIMAYLNFGVWALVAQYLVNSTIDIIVLFITIEWRPKLMFSILNAKKMLKYGWKITIGSLVDEIYNQARSLIIGKKYDTANLALYNKGNQFPKLMLTNINSAISGVLFPAMCNVNEKKENVRNICRNFIKTVSYIISPMMIGLFVVAPSVIKILLTDNWIGCVLFLRISCITYMLTPINTANLQAIKAMGRSDLFLKIEVLKKVIGIIILLISMNFGIYILAFSTILVQLICNIVNIFASRKIINYGYIEQIMDILPSIAISIVMGIISYYVSFINMNVILLLIVQILLGILVYVVLSKVFKIEGFEMVKRFIKNRISEKKGGI